MRPKFDVGMKSDVASSPNCAVNSSEVASTARPDDWKARAMASTGCTPLARRSL
jgi:hypothetical protein